MNMLVRNLYEDSGGIHTPWTRLEGACEQADMLNNSQAFRTRPQALPTRVRLSVLEVARLDPLEIIMATREPVEVIYSFPARLSVPRRLFFEYALQKGGDLDAKPRLSTLLSRAAAQHFFLDISPEIRSTLGSRLRSTAASLLRNSGPLFTRIHCLAKSRLRVLARHPPIASGGGLKRGSSTASTALMLEPNIA